MRRTFLRYRRKVAVLLALLTGLGLLGAVPANAETGAPLAHPVWLCRPGLVANPCNQTLTGESQAAEPGGKFTAGYPMSHGRVPLDVTRVEADGRTGVEPFESPSAPPVDCFFVYPTVNVLPNPLPQLGSLPPARGDDQMAVTLAQAGPLLGRCRMFVPSYRQASLAAHVVGVATRTTPDYALGLRDVEQAWDTYWRDYNVDPVTHRRRGVVLLGHSQGAADVASLIRDRVDGRPDVQPSLVSALLLGGNVPVPIDRPAGGGADPDAAFQYVPVCARASAAQPVPTGCVTGYSSYKQPGDRTLPPDSVFGVLAKPGHRILCLNPATLLTGAPADASADLDARLPTQRLVEGNPLLPGGHLALLLAGTTLTTHPTGYARYPGLVSGQCLFREYPGGNASWLQVRGGDAQIGGPGTGQGLGLHVKDFNLALGDLTALVAAQSAEWLRTH
ncbi:DUF3089 domain-containing protein [Amycolatopsis sp. NPDC059027]|uniref:DUF3089 domain-containing protein n=1 Tax=unclassified Amycolatopsis TaxID=2618356 RepID=UPI0036700819